MSAQIINFPEPQRDPFPLAVLLQRREFSSLVDSLMASRPSQSREEVESMARGMLVALHSALDVQLQMPGLEP